MRGDGTAAAGGASEDDALLARVAAGDSAAWSAIVARHLPRLVGYAWRLTGTRAEAEDVAQECFVRLVRKAPEWRPGEASLATWLHRVATNQCIDRHRRGTPAALDDIDPELIATPGAGAVDRAIDVTRTVRRALAALPERQRAAVVLAHYQGFANPEVARILGVSVEAVESLLARGRRALKKDIEAAAPELLWGENG